MGDSPGGVAEWLNAPVLKTGNGPVPFAGSNPAPTVIVARAGDDTCRLLPPAAGLGGAPVPEQKRWPPAAMRTAGGREGRALECGAVCAGCDAGCDRPRRGRCRPIIRSDMAGVEPRKSWGDRERLEEAPDRSGGLIGTDRLADLRGWVIGSIAIRSSLWSPRYRIVSRLGMRRRLSIEKSSSPAAAPIVAILPAQPVVVRVDIDV